MSFLEFIHFRKLNLAAGITVIFLAAFAGEAWATSASISVSGNEGAIPLNASATFTSYEHCDSATPPNCSNVDTGTLSVYQDGTRIGGSSGWGAASWSTTIDGGSLPQGDHTYSATAVDSEGVSDTATTVIHIDNTPEITANSRGTVEGLFEITGSATFKPRWLGYHGLVKIVSVGGVPRGVYKSYSQQSVNWRSSEIIGWQDAGSYSNGNHTMVVQAVAANGAASPLVTATFTVDNTPTITVNSPGVVKGAFDITGTATFKPRLGYHGLVKIVSIEGIQRSGLKSYTIPNVSWKFSEIGGSLHSDLFAAGKYALTVQAIAANGATSQPATGYFIINKPVAAPSNTYFGSDTCEACVVRKTSKVGNPISIYEGNNFETQEDLRFPSPGGEPFVFKRHYNSKSGIIANFGYGWTHNLKAFLNFDFDYKGNIYLRILDETGRGLYFEEQGNGYYAGAFKERTFVKVEDGKATVRGKVWPRDDKEPEEWTIEAVDPHANENGSPGLYLYSMAEAYYDNIIVTKD